MWKKESVLRITAVLTVLLVLFLLGCVLTGGPVSVGPVRILPEGALGARATAALWILLGAVSAAAVWGAVCMFPLRRKAAK